MSKRAWMVVGMVAGIAACGEGAGTNASSQTVEPVGMVSLAPSTHAGVASDRNTYVALVVSGTEVTAYACDGRVGSWFRGSAFSLPATLRASDGRELTLDRLGGRYEGTIRGEGAEALTFVLDEMRGDALFRAEAHEAGASWLGGWVVLPDGTQRGLVANTAGVSCSPPLNALERSLTTTMCSTAVPPLTPAPFTPAALAQPRANLAERRFTIAAFGDSYASGEGAPATAGSHNNDGEIGTSGHTESWGTGLPQGYPASLTFTDDERRRASDVAHACHRSDVAGSAIAREILQREFPNVAVGHASFACSGATTAQIHRDPDSGHGSCERYTGDAQRVCRNESDEGFLPANLGVAPQIDQYNALVGRAGIRADVAYFSIGGNDLGFGDIITDCVKPFSNCAASDSASRQLLARTIPALGARYNAIAEAMVRRTGIPASQTFITLYPSPLSKSAGAQCVGDDFSRQNDALLSHLTPEEVTFAIDALDQINTAVTSAARDMAVGWNVVDRFTANAVGHGMCASEPWFNNLPAALRTQGSDLPTVVPLVDGVVDLLTSISTGMVHPNAAGHAQLYGPAIADAVRPSLRARFTPAAPERLRVVAQRAGQGVTIAWDDRSDIESEVRIEGTSLDGLGASFVRTAAADAVSAELPTPGAGVWRVRVRACFNGGTPTSDLCSEPVSLDVTARLPRTAPANVAVTQALSTNVTWSAVVDPAHLFYTVDFDGATDVSTQGLRATTSSRPTRVRVASCNLLGCGPASAFVAVPAAAMAAVCPTGQVRSVTGACVPDTRPVAQAGRLPGA